MGMESYVGVSTLELMIRNGSGGMTASVLNTAEALAQSKPVRVRGKSSGLSFKIPVYTALRHPGSPGLL